MTNEELLASAKAFRELVDPDTAIAPGSMIGLWLATADALEDALIERASAVALTPWAFGEETP